ncbi:HGGxSTG domain-containing protein [Streptomyces sp. NPDC057011]|uniref:HGGxSTG domain-containing protein n=1 Tax=unclassified Streptomyces TaxID=2593676 RepID=UPI003639ED44
MSETHSAPRSRVRAARLSALPAPSLRPSLARPSRGQTVDDAGSRWGRMTQPRCGARTAKGRPCTKPAIMNGSRCQLHQGGWSSYGVAQQKKKEAQAKMRKLRKKK